MSYLSADIHTLYETPFFDLLNKAHNAHRENFNPHEIECCSLLNIKTGLCPEDCAYCPQSAHYKTSLNVEKLLDIDTILKEAKIAKANGATRFCMGAAWRSPPKKDFPKIMKIIQAVKAEGLETCVTLGMLDENEAQALKASGLDYYNHNLDTSPEFYKKIITTRTYQDRLETLKHVHVAGLHVCCGGILGMGETREDRIQFLLALTGLTEPPQSIPLNQLIPIPGTPLADTPTIEPFEFIRTVAITRLLFPKSMIRLSAGRENMSEEMQALCFFSGANSIFLGDKLLTAKNSSFSRDKQLFEKIGLKARSHLC